MAQYIYTMNRVSKVVPPKRQILRDISLSFFPGAKIGVLGLNGAGKSTLLKILSGIVAPDAGQILLEGRAVAIHSPHVAMHLVEAAESSRLQPDADVGAPRVDARVRAPACGGIRPRAEWFA